MIITAPSGQCATQVNNRCPLSLKIDWWQIPPYIYKDKDGEVSGIFPDILKRLVEECCDKDPAINNQPKVQSCVKLNYSAVPSNDSEVVKKHIDMNGTYCKL